MAQIWYLTLGKKYCQFAISESIGNIFLMKTAEHPCTHRAHWQVPISGTMGGICSPSRQWLRQPFSLVCTCVVKHTPCMMKLLQQKRLAPVLEYKLHFENTELGVCNTMCIAIITPCHCFPNQMFISFHHILFLMMYQHFPLGHIPAFVMQSVGF